MKRVCGWDGRRVGGVGGGCCVCVCGGGGGGGRRVLSGKCFSYFSIKTFSVGTH